MKVVGIDPSLTACGLARADGSMECYTGAAALGDGRLVTLHDAVYAVLLEDDPDLVVMEDAPANTKGSGPLGMVQGVIRLALCRRRVPYALVVHASLKKYATGDGRADKSDLRMELYQRAGIDERNDNKVDAWWLRHMGLDHLGEPPLKLPALNRKSLDVVRWPELTERTPAR